MDFPGLARFPWVPWIIALAALLIVVLSALTVRSRRRLWKVLLGLSAAVILIGSCAGLGIVSLYHEPAMSVNRPAPVSDSLSLSFMQNLHGPNILTTLNARTGAMRWQHVVRASTRLSTADEHTLYLMEEETQSIFAVRASDGKELWRTLLHHPSESTASYLQFSSPVVVDGMLYFNAVAGYYSSISQDVMVVFALHAATGTLAWTSVVNTADQIEQTGTIAVGQGMLFVGSRMGEVFALRASDGAHVWSQRSQPDEYLSRVTKVFRLNSGS
jgi:outer membrane protein assembly factor BamB